MIDANQDVVTKLAAGTGLNVYYELFVEEASVPCISYILSGDYSYGEGSNLRYSYVTYTIKVWTKTVDDLQDYSQKVDNSMKELGFVRVGALDMSYNNTLCKVLNYRGLGKERITGGN